MSVDDKHKQMNKMKKYNILQEDIARYFGYSNVDSFRNSTRKDTILKGVEQLVKRIEEEIVKKIENQ